MLSLWQSGVGVWIIGFLLISYCHRVSSNGGLHRFQDGVESPIVSSIDPIVEIDSLTASMLKSGRPYKTRTQKGDAGANLVIQDVFAPVNMVWDQVLDFSNYKDKGPNMYESQIYRSRQLEGERQIISVRMKSGNPLMKFQYYLNHDYNPIENSLTWILDYTMKSDLDHSVGQWYIIPHPDNPTKWTRLYYSVQVAVKSRIGQLVFDFTSYQALTATTSWVKAYSEALSSQMEDNDQQNASTGKMETSWKSKLFSLKVNSLAEDEKINPNEAIESETCVSNDATTRSEQGVQHQKVGLRRYALIATIIALSLYEIHLYFSQ